VALIGHATGEWEEGGEGVQGGGEVREKFRNLQVARGGRRLTRGHDNEYTYTQYMGGNVQYICRLPGRRSTPHMEWGYTLYSTVPYLSKELKIRQNMKNPKSAKIL
jgi:hypothetical protein